MILKPQTPTLPPRMADEQTRYGPIGIDAGIVYTISHGRVAAVVSDAANKNIRPERRHLAAHHAVLRRLMEEGTPLPMAFGMIADAAGAVREAISLNYDALVEQLLRVKDKVEMSLRVRWDVPNIFEYFVGTHEELCAVRDRLFLDHREPTRDDKIELGRLFDRILREERAAHARTVLSVLQPRCSEIEETVLRTEHEVANFACLVRRQAQQELEEAVLQAAKLFDNNYSFDFGGPFPPHNFVDVKLLI
jgi:hypothetical protein